MSLLSALFRRIVFALAATLICVLFAIIVAGGAAFFLIILSIASVAAPLTILIAGPGPIGSRISFTRRRRNRHDEAIDI